MQQKRFTLGNYRAFPDTVAITIRPLTLVYGYNSAGKSALLRWLPLLKDSTYHSERLPLNLHSEAARGATFSDLTSKFTSTPSISFSISLDNVEVFYTIRNIPEKKSQIVQLLRLTESDGSVSTLEWSPTDSNDQQYKVSRHEKISTADIRFTGLFPDPENLKSKDVLAVGLLASRVVRRWTSNIYWLQANRAIPKRKEAYTGSLREISPDGEGITQRLVAEDSAGSDVIQALSKWYQNATGFPLTLQRGAFLSTELFSFCLSAAGGSIELADTGEGMGQVLPILGLLLLAERGRLGPTPTLVFEHPELHLHSAAEPALANLLCQVAASKSAEIIAETHSESFLLSLQLSILDGHLDPKDVAVYWVRQSDGQAATVDEILFDAEGRPIGGGWPPGVFNEKVDQARKVVLARRARQSDAG